MLTSHEFMVANKKRRTQKRSNYNNRDNGQSFGNEEFTQQVQPEPNYVPVIEAGKVYNGSVQNYYREKGYGFIRCDDFEVPLFFHYSEIQLDGFKYLIKQQKVEFKARLSDEGKLQAYVVTPLELAPTQKAQIFNNNKNTGK